MAPPLEDGLTGLTGSSTPLGLLAYEIDVSVNGAMDIIPFPVFVSVNTVFSCMMRITWLARTPTGEIYWGV